MLASWKKSYDQPRQHIKKQRHYFANKGLSSQGYSFSSSHVWIWELDYKESWVRRIDAFELWCWRRLLRVPWTARRPNQSILKEISPECSLEGLMLKLILQYCGHLMQRADSLEKTLMLGKIEGRRRRGWQRMRWLDGITDSTDMIWASSRSWWWTGKPGVLQSMGYQRVGHDWATELNWISSNWQKKKMFHLQNIRDCRTKIGRYEIEAAWYDKIIHARNEKKIVYQGKNLENINFGLDPVKKLVIEPLWGVYPCILFSPSELLLKACLARLCMVVDVNVRKCVCMSMNESVGVYTGHCQKR